MPVPERASPQPSVNSFVLAEMIVAAHAHEEVHQWRRRHRGRRQVVGNNAASMGNNTINCNVTAWYHANFTAPDSAHENWLSPGHAGNFTSTMRDNERLINVNHCT